MPIAKKPKRDQKTIEPIADESAAQAFIEGAGKQKKDDNEANKKPVLVRFDADLLARVDKAAKHRGVSRAAWIQFTLSRVLDTDEG